MYCSIMYDYMYSVRLISFSTHRYRIFGGIDERFSTSHDLSGSV